MSNKKGRNCSASLDSQVYSNNLGTAIEPVTETPLLNAIVAHPQILVVDDDEDNRDVIAACLTLGGYQVTSASTAQEALQISQTQSFDAYVLDTRLPDLDGFQLCRHICARKAEAVLIFSAAARPIDIAQGLEAGAQAYLTKPLGFDELLETVERLIKIKALSKVSRKLQGDANLMSTETAYKIAGNRNHQ